MEEKSWKRRSLVNEVFLQNENVCPRMDGEIFL